MIILSTRFRFKRPMIILSTRFRFFKGSCHKQFMISSPINGNHFGSTGNRFGTALPFEVNFKSRNTRCEETSAELGSKHIPDSTAGSKLFNGDRHKTNASPTCVDSCSTHYQKPPYISAFPEY